MWILLPVVACTASAERPEGEDTGGAWVAPDNSWGLCDEPPASLTGEGLEVGQVAPEFHLFDQYGVEVSLWQFHGCTVLLNFSAGWNPFCPTLAAEAQSIADDYREHGVRYLTVIAEDIEGEIPDQAFLDQWGDAFELREPILSDAVGYTYELLVPGTDRSYPAVLLLDADGRVVEDLSVPTDASIRAALEDAL